MIRHGKLCGYFKSRQEALTFWEFSKFTPPCGELLGSLWWNEHIVTALVFPKDPMTWSLNLNLTTQPGNSWRMLATRGVLKELENFRSCSSSTCSDWHLHITSRSWLIAAKWIHACFIVNILKDDFRNIQYEVVCCNSPKLKNGSFF